MSKYTINLSPEMEGLLTELANKQGVTKSTVIRRAVGLMKYLADEREDGGKVLIETEGERVKEIVFEDELG